MGPVCTQEELTMLKNLLLRMTFFYGSCGDFTDGMKVELDPRSSDLPRGWWDNVAEGVAPWTLRRQNTISAALRQLRACLREWVTRRTKTAEEATNQAHFEIRVLIAVEVARGIKQPASDATFLVQIGDTTTEIAGVHAGILQNMRTYEELLDATDEKMTHAILTEVQNAVSVRKFYIAQDSYFLYELELQLLTRGLVRAPIRGFLVEGAARFFGYTGPVDMLIGQVVLDLAMESQLGFILAVQKEMKTQEVWGNIDHLPEFVATIVKLQNAMMVAMRMKGGKNKLTEVDEHHGRAEPKNDHGQGEVVVRGAYTEVNRSGNKPENEKVQLKCLVELAGEARQNEDLDLARLYLSARRRFSEAVMGNDATAVGELLQNNVDQLNADVETRQVQRILDCVFRGVKDDQEGGSGDSEATKFGTSLEQ